SGDVIDLSSIKGLKVDKHSTGGVADSTSLALAPILACAGLQVAKMSGRGLGFSGGTIDKLESIPGFNTSLSEERFAEVVNEVGCSIIGQTTDVAPADKKIYALRDVTGTVDCMPLIASSIMSKKLASGSDVILLDVKFGSGAFMKNVDDAIALAELMVKIGENAGKTVGALITSMQQPLGDKAGNSLEILSVIDLLKGEKSRLLTEVTEVAVKLILLSKFAKDERQAEEMVEKAISSGEAFKRFVKMVELHGGDTSYILNPEKFELGKIAPIYAKASGYISKIYGYPELKLIIIIGALSPFFNSLSTQFASVLKR
ncbi:MAG: thymidine phosphorylase, partial [Clostridia bacterium]